MEALTATNKGFSLDCGNHTLSDYAVEQEVEAILLQVTLLRWPPCYGKYFCISSQRSFVACKYIGCLKYKVGTLSALWWHVRLHATHV
ncbi:unnamed protein product [Urochloa humidicola]